MGPADATLPARKPAPMQVRIDTHPTTSINNRFTPLADLGTDAVFNVDDDMVGKHAYTFRVMRRFVCQTDSCRGRLAES